MYVMIKVAGEKHLKTQIGDKIYFDLVNFESVESYRIHKNTSFEDFKEMVFLVLFLNMYLNEIRYQKILE